MFLYIIMPVHMHEAVFSHSSPVTVYSIRNTHSQRLHVHVAIALLYIAIILGFYKFHEHRLDLHTLFASANSIFLSSKLVILDGTKKVVSYMHQEYLF